MSPEKRHFLVVASASRGARFFVKDALRRGHDVTALCRAPDDAAALQRMNALLAETKLTKGGDSDAERPGVLKASSKNVTDDSTYQEVLAADPTIDALCCFVGVTSHRDMMNSSLKLYARTMTAMVNGMRQSRWVETFYHGSVGSTGLPGSSTVGWPQNYNLLFKFYCFVLVPMLYPVYRDVTDSENILAHAGSEGLKFIIFRPAMLTDGPAQRRVGFSFNNTSMDEGDLPLRHADVSIAREDVAEQILHVATLSPSERSMWHGAGVYMVTMKDTYRGSFVHRP
ncbi:MAG: hypothetical protein AAF909_06640 [Pseudomonadota bacterium]